MTLQLVARLALMLMGLALFIIPAVCFAVLTWRWLDERQAALRGQTRLHREWAELARAQRPPDPKLASVLRMVKRDQK